MILLKWNVFSILHFFEPSSVVAVTVLATVVTRIKCNGLRKMKLNPHQSRGAAANLVKGSFSRDQQEDMHRKNPVYHRAAAFRHGNGHGGTSLRVQTFQGCGFHCVKWIFNNKTKPVKITGAATQTSPAINTFPHSHIHLPSLPYVSHLGSSYPCAHTLFWPISLDPCTSALALPFPACQPVLPPSALINLH